MGDKLEKLINSEIRGEITKKTATHTHTMSFLSQSFLLCMCGAEFVYRKYYPLSKGICV